MEQERRFELSDSLERIRKVIHSADYHKLSFARILRSAAFDPHIAKDVEAVLRVATGTDAASAPSEVQSVAAKWSISTDEEHYHGNFDTLEDAIQEGIQYGTFHVGQCIAPTPPETLFDAEIIAHWLEQVWDHEDYSGDWADGPVHASREQRNELAEQLRPLVAAWLDRHKLRPTHWNIDPLTVRYFDVDKGFSIIS